LRLKAAEFLRLAGEGRDPIIVDELRTLATLCLEEAAELERRPPNVVAPPDAPRRK
jgi:hypothetical protein